MQHLQVSSKLRRSIVHEYHINPVLVHQLSEVLSMLLSSKSSLLVFITYIEYIFLAVVQQAATSSTIGVTVVDTHNKFESTIVLRKLWDNMTVLVEASKNLSFENVKVLLVFLSEFLGRTGTTSFFNNRFWNARVIAVGTMDGGPTTKFFISPSVIEGTEPVITTRSTNEQLLTVHFIKHRTNLHVKGVTTPSINLRFFINY